MIPKDIILYVEDDLWEGAERRLHRSFPDYDVVVARSSFEVDEKCDREIISLERIAIVCTDGALAEFSTGWEVMEGLRARGYTGPALYMGATPLPADKEHLYSGRCNKAYGIEESILKYLVKE